MSRIRAVGIVLRGPEVLVMFRRKQGNEYWCFPGGAVEPGETSEQAAVREVAEETSIVVEVAGLLYRLEKLDGNVEFFYRCRYISGEPSVNPGSPEAERMQGDNYYRPQWAPLANLSKLLVYPLEVRDWLIEDAANDFVACPREAKVEAAKLRRAL